MTLNSIKSALVPTLVKATPFLDNVGIKKIGLPYVYLARPALAALHGYHSTTDDVANIAYNALAFPIGHLVTTKGPIAGAIQKASNLIANGAHNVTQKIFSSPLPCAAISIFATTYAKLRMSLYLRKMIPFTMASLGGALIYREPRTTPSKWELFFWVIEALSLISTVFEKIKDNHKQTQEEKLARALVVAIENGDEELAKALSDLITKGDEESVKAMLDLIQKREEQKTLTGQTQMPAPAPTATGTPSEPAGATTAAPAPLPNTASAQTTETPATTLSDKAKQARILELARNLHELREQRKALL